MDNELSNRIKNKRKIAGLTQCELGNKVGVSDVTVLRWERGERVPNASMLPKLAEALKTSVEYLMGLSDADTPQERLEEKSTVNNINDPLFGKRYEYDAKNAPQMTPLGSSRVFSYECNGNKVEIPASQEYVDLFLKIVQDMNNNRMSTINNTANACDFAQAYALMPQSLQKEKEKC